MIPFYFVTQVPGGFIYLLRGERQVYKSLDLINIEMELLHTRNV